MHAVRDDMSITVNILWDVMNRTYAKNVAALRKFRKAKWCSSEIILTKVIPEKRVVSGYKRGGT